MREVRQSVGMRDKYLIQEERKVNGKLKEGRKDENKGRI